MIEYEDVTLTDEHGLTDAGFLAEVLGATEEGED